MAGIKKIIFRGHAILASLYVIAQVTFAWGADKSSYNAGIVPSPQTYSYTYDGNRRIEGPTNIVRKYVTDHLGNVRAIVTGDNVVERSDYYPFDGRHQRNTLPLLSSNRWRLGAKETQD